jgi:hypothetical protein
VFLRGLFSSFSFLKVVDPFERSDEPEHLPLIHHPDMCGTSVFDSSEMQKDYSSDPNNLPVSKPKPNTMPTSPITQDTAAAKASAGGRIRSVSEVCEAEGRDGMKRRITATHAACRTS